MNQLPSTRKMRRITERYGESFLYRQSSKHGPRVKKNGEFTFGGRAPSPKVKRGSKRRQVELTGRKKARYLQSQSTRAERSFRGLMKFRALGLRAGVLFIPYGESEMHDIIEKAKQEYDTDGVLAADTVMKLRLAGYDVDRMVEIWEMMKNAEVNPAGMEPTAEQLSSASEDTPPINNFE